MLSDIRYVIRSLARTKGFLFITIVTLALGIGSAAAIFTMVDWVLFRTSSFPTDLYLIGAKDKQGEFLPTRIDAQFRAYQSSINVFSEFGLAGMQPVNVVLGGNPLVTQTLGISPNLLPMLGIAPVLGRGFLPDEGVDGRNQVVVISDNFWRRHFNASPDVLGRKILVDQAVCTVVGVLKAWQSLPPYFYAEVYRPLVYKVDPTTPWNPNLFVLGRLRPGVPRLAAEQALAAVKVEMPPNLAVFFADQKPALSTLAETQKLYRPEIYWLLLGAVGFLYAIACLNATNLMLVRMLGKKRELSIRLALGGGRWRIIRLFVVESLGLSLGGCAGGVLIANWLVPLFSTFWGGHWEGGWALWSLSWRALAFLGGLSVATGFAIVLLPALRILRTDIQAGLREGGAALGESRRLARLRGTFVVLQAAFAVILLTGAGLMVRTFQRFQSINLGFDVSRRVKVQLEFPSGYVTGNEVRLALLRRLQDRLQHLPGVASVAYGTDNLMSGWNGGGSTVQLADGTPIEVKIDYVSSDYLETAGLKLKRGRWFNQPSGTEIMINESFARVRYGREDPVGQMLKPVNAAKGWGGWLVVGVVGDVRETVRSAPGYHIYGPESWYPPSMTTLVVRLTHDPDGTMESQLRRSIYEFDPRIVTGFVIPLGEARNQQTLFEHFALSILKVLSGIATVLTVVGLFSVLAYTVDRRMSEFGIRLALGATARDVMILIMGRGVLLTALGIAVGLAGALALTRFLQSLLYETPPYEPVVLGAVAVLLVLAAIAASVIPSVRATRADISRLLRAE
jgi:putative ABC transport system permease protein